MKHLSWVIGGMFLLIVVALLCYKGVKVDHNVQGAKNQTIILPPSTHTIEIPRGNGKPPFKLNIISPEKKIELHRDQDK